MGAVATGGGLSLRWPLMNAAGIVVEVPFGVHVGARGGGCDVPRRRRTFTIVGGCGCRGLLS